MGQRVVVLAVKFECHWSLRHKYALHALLTMTIYIHSDINRDGLDVLPNVLV